MAYSTSKSITTGKNGTPIITGKDNQYYTTSSVGYGTFTGTVTYPNYTYQNTTTTWPSWGGSSTVIREESPDEIFNKTKLIRTKDGEVIQLTYAEIYEFKRMKKIPEQMTKDEITDILLVLRI
jgi:hypothetical protein